MKSSGKKKKQKILMLLLKDFAPDPRVLKEAKYLVKKGYEIEIVAWKYTGDYPKVKYNDFKVVHLGPQLVSNFEKRNILVKILSALYSVTGFSINAFLYSLKRKFNIIHSHDLTSLHIGTALKIFTGKKLVYDSHEDYPSLLRDMSFVLYWPGLLLEKFCSFFVDGIITINKQFAKKLSRYGKPVVIAANYIDLTWFDSRYDKKIVDRVKKKYGITKNKLVAMYVGIVKEIRGLKEVVSAKKLLDKKIRDNVVIMIVGDGPYYKRLKAFAQSENQPDVYVTGKVPYDEIPSYTALADIGLHTQYMTRNNKFCSPNKLFEYMAGKSALVVSTLPGMRYIVEDNQIGYTVAPKNAQQIADAISTLAKDTKKLKQIGDKSRKLVEKEYNWNSQMKNVEKLYQKISKK